MLNDVSLKTPVKACRRKYPAAPRLGPAAAACFAFGRFRTIALRVCRSGASFVLRQEEFPHAADGSGAIRIDVRNFLTWPLVLNMHIVSCTTKTCISRTIP